MALKKKAEYDINERMKRFLSSFKYDIRRAAVKSNISKIDLIRLVSTKERRKIVLKTIKEFLIG